VRRLAEYLTIVPEAHVRWLDVPLQWRLYEVFHHAAACRWGHLAATPVIVAGQIALAAAVSLGPLDLGWVLAAMLTVAWLLVDVSVALGLGGALVAIHVAADALAPSPAASLAVIAAGAVIQAASHVVEPIPPPWTGGVAFRPLGEVLRDRRAHLLRGWPVLALSGAVLEAWAAPRIWPYQVLTVLAPLGYRRAEREAMREGRAEILADCRRLWRSEASP
jgi:hypothetical protein